MVKSAGDLNIGNGIDGVAVAFLILRKLNSRIPL